jgi:hypothetical protein
MPCLDPPFVLIVCHAAHDKIKGYRTLRRQWRQDLRQTKTNLRQQIANWCSLEKLYTLVYTTGPSSFHIENLDAILCLKMILDNSEHDERSRYIISLL